MQEALVIARSAFATGDVPVGAVVMDNFGEILGEGRNEREEHHDRHWIIGYAAPRRDD